jgi:NAD(P)-dependent dehydrogenase (short-subunit alcohol dehydrogenase family)
MVANAGLMNLQSIVDGAQAEIFTLNLRNFFVDSVTTEEWDRIIGINLRGPFLCYKYAAMQMIGQGRGGRIIGASSVAGKQGIFHIFT